MVQLLLDDERIDTNAVELGQDTILFKLCNYFPGKDGSYARELEAIKTLLASPRVDIGVVQYGIGLPLHMVCWNKHDTNFALPITEAFLKAFTERGIDINQRNNEGRSVLHYAFGYNPNSRLRYITKKTRLKILLSA